jgi:hypothetical protein
MLKPNFLLYLTILGSLLVVIHAGNNYSKDERLALQKFRPLVQDFLTLEYQKTDSYLIKWLRARDLDLDEASAMLRKAMQWRRDNKIDSILKKRNILVENGFVVSDDTYDKEGSPVLTISFRNFDIRNLLLEGKKDQMNAGAIQIWEKMSIKAHAASERTGNDISQMVVIADMQGFTTTQHACISCLAFMRDFTKALEEYYPGLRKYDITVNVPRTYDIFLKNLSPLLSKETKKIIHTFGSDRTEWSKFILNIIDANQLPYRFGGTKNN